MLDKALARTYARRVSGTPTAMHFDHKTGNFTLTYTPSSDPAVLALPTEVYVNLPFYYPSGARWAAQPPSAVTATFNQTTSTFLFSHTAAAAGEEALTISITPV